MKKLIAMAAIAFAAFQAPANTITNYVYVVSNIFTQAFTETVITQKVKSTHYDYYYTNNVYTVSNVTLLVSKTNQTVMLDVGRDFLLAASNQANRAESAVGDAQAVVGQASQSATAAASSASAASASASSAAATRSAAANECASALATINARINWFDQHSGETITQINITSNITINVNAQDYSYAYTNAAGQSFNYVTVHPYGANGGATVAARSSGAYNTVKIRAWPRPRPSGTGYWWDFSPAYVDYDDKGMRLQYLPDTTVPIPYVGGSGVYPNGKIVPEYFYWQSGYIYFKVRVWENGSVVAWCLTRYKWDNWPSTIGYGGDNGTAMTLVDREGYGTSDMGTTLAYFYSKTRTDSANTSIEFPMSPSPSFDSTLAWMRDGPKISVLEDRMTALETSVTASIGSFDTRLTAAETSVATSIASFDSRLAAIEGGNPHAYVGPSGTTYSNITYYEKPVANGKVSVGTVGNFYPSTEYRFYLNFGGNPSANYWTFAPAYVDSDINGMRLHYLPKEQKTFTYSSYDSGCVYIPRDFYWQDGTIYMVVESFKDSVWKGTLRMKYTNTGNYQYPNGIYHTSADTTASYYVHFLFDSREGTIMGTSTGQWQPGHMKTANGKYIANYNGLIWFPAELTAEQRVIADWLATFHR